MDNEILKEQNKNSTELNEGLEEYMKRVIMENITKGNAKTHENIKNIHEIYKQAHEEALMQQMKDCILNPKTTTTSTNDEAIYKEECYNDGDQSKICGVKESQHLQSLWSSGRNWNPKNPIFSKFSRLCIFGSHKNIEENLSLFKENSIELFKLLEKRESQLRMNSVLNLIAGARTYANKDNKEQDYCKSLKILIKYGANINAKDFAGNTPFMHCFTCYGNDLTLKLAEILLESGANINEQNRIGTTALYEPTIGYKFKLCKWLIEHGADPSIGEYTNNITPIVLSRAYPSLTSLYSAHMTKQKQNEILNCAYCGKKCTKHCAKCLKTYYCSKECQKTDWPTHRKICASNLYENKSTNMNSENIVSLNNSQYKSMEIITVASKQTNNKENFNQDENENKFALKFQIPIDQSADAMMCYNHDRSICFLYLQSYPKYKVIYDKIVKDGVAGVKGFFAAWINNTTNELMIDVSSVIPPKSW